MKALIETPQMPSAMSSNFFSSSTPSSQLDSSSSTKAVAEARDAPFALTFFVVSTLVFSSVAAFSNSLRFNSVAVGNLPACSQKVECCGQTRLVDEGANEDVVPIKTDAAAMATAAADPPPLLLLPTYILHPANYADLPVVSSALARFLL